MLGMEREHPRRMISDRVWEELKAALAEAKHSRAGAPAELSDRDFLEAVLYLNRVGCPWRDLPPELGYWHAVYMRFRNQLRAAIEANMNMEIFKATQALEIEDSKEIHRLRTEIARAFQG